MSTNRLGKHGGLAFLREGVELVALRDELHRKDRLRFRDRHLPGGVGFVSTLSGRSLLVGAERDRPMSAIEAALARLNPPFGIRRGGVMEHEMHATDEKVPKLLPTRRDLNYHELDRDASAMLVMTFHLEHPAQYGLQCDVVGQDSEGFWLPANTRLWSLGSIRPSVEGDTLIWSFPAGVHTIQLVVWSRSTTDIIHPGALLIRRRDSWLAALAQASVNGLLPTFPVDTQTELEEAMRLLSLLEPGPVIVQDAKTRDHLLAANVPVQRIDILPEGGNPAVWISEALESQTIVTDLDLSADTPDPARWLPAAQRTFMRKHGHLQAPMLPRAPRSGASRQR